jgi:hypothetical protein
MRFATRPGLLLCTLLLTALGACAGDGSVGRPCVITKPPTGSQSVIETPSLDCDSRLCLQLQVDQPAMCTAECGEVGEACTAVDGSLCPGDFRCEIPFVVGPFAGRTLCVCEPFYSAVP